MWKTLALACPVTAALDASMQPPPPFDCADLSAVAAAVWRHPGEPQLVAVLCRHDPFPGWWDSLWLMDTRRADAPVVVAFPLHGTGIDRFAWLDCPGALLAHVVDSTHMGTITDQVVEIEPGGRIEIIESVRLPPGTGTGRTQVPCP